MCGEQKGLKPSWPPLFKQPYKWCVKFQYFSLRFPLVNLLFDIVTACFHVSNAFISSATWESATVYAEFVHKMNFTLRTDGDFCHQGRGTQKSCPKKCRIVETYWHDHSLESSWGALSDGTITLRQPFRGNVHFLYNILGAISCFEPGPVFETPCDIVLTLGYSGLLWERWLMQFLVPERRIWKKK
jgi:hypothetical protein